MFPAMFPVLFPAKPRFSAVIPAFVGLFLLAAPAQAECVGQNLLDAMPETQRAALLERTHAVPFSQGNFWHAQKDGQEITLIGTYHMEDTRHDATMARLVPVLDRAHTVLVEAGPEEMSALQEMLGKDPDLMVITDGPTLPEQLTPQIWDKLSVAMRARGVPPFMAAKMKPWYLAMLLSIPPCALEAMGEDKGLDALVIEAATARNLPLRGLEPFDTIFGIFGTMGAQDQLSMITASLALEDQSEDMSVTMADSYFREESRLIWEFSRDLALTVEGATPEQVAQEFAVMEEAMMLRRNRSWIPVLTGAAKDGPVLAAFGALHLSGDQGVLALLQAEGYTLERLAFQ